VLTDYVKRQYIGKSLAKLRRIVVVTAYGLIEGMASFTFEVVKRKTSVREININYRR